MMKKELIFAGAVVLFAQVFAGGSTGLQTVLFNGGWTFAKDETCRLTVDVADRTLAFKPVELPHDWAIGGPWLPSRAAQRREPVHGHGRLIGSDRVIRRMRQGLAGEVTVFTPRKEKCK